MNSKKVIMYKVVLLFLFIVITSQVFSTNSTAKMNSEKTVVKTDLNVSVITWPGCAFGYLAQELGYYKNINVNFVVRNETSIRRTEFKSGRSDLMVTTCDSLAIEEFSGISGIVIMATDISNGADGLLIKKEIGEIKNLKDKKIAFAEGTPSHFLLLEILKRNGLGPKDFKPVTVDDPNKAATLLLSGKVDGALTWEPYLTKTASKEKFLLAVSTAELKPSVVGAYLASKEIIKKDPNAIKEFVSGWLKAVEYYKSNPNEALPIMSKHLQIPQDDLKNMLFVDKIADSETNKDLFKKSNDSIMCKIIDSAWGQYFNYGIINGTKERKGKIICSNSYLP